MDDKDTLIISATDSADINLEPLDLSKITTLNLDDLIKDIDISYTANTMQSSLTGGGGSGGGGAWGGGGGGSGAGQYVTIGNNYGSYNYTSPQINPLGSPGLHVKGDAEFQGDIKWKGRSLANMLETIERRLSILVPDPEKLEHYEALKKAYEHYKTLEALCEKPSKEEDQ